MSFRKIAFSQALLKSLTDCSFKAPLVKTAGILNWAGKAVGNAANKATNAVTGAAGNAAWGATKAVGGTALGAGKAVGGRIWNKAVARHGIMAAPVLAIGGVAGASAIKSGISGFKNNMNSFNPAVVAAKRGMS